MWCHNSLLLPTIVLVLISFVMNYIVVELVLLFLVVNYIVDLMMCVILVLCVIFVLYSLPVLEVAKTDNTKKIKLLYSSVNR
jgi:hypothetical protein